MLKWIITLLKIAGVVIVAVAAIGAAWIYLGGPARNLEPHFAGTCRSLGLGESAEDIQIDRERGFAYLSLIDRLSLTAGEPAQGWIGRLDLGSEPYTVEPALLDPPAHFRPHGISLFIDGDGRRTLAVINHPVERGTEPEHVELFTEERPGVFRHLRSFTDPLIARPNDLVATGHEQYYVANDSPPNSGELTQLVYVNRDRARSVADDIASGGGINVSADLRTLYVAETGANAIRLMRRDPATGAVESLERIQLESAPDNIDVAADGSLWVGAHASLLGLVLHFIVGTDAPSQVLRVSADDGTIEEIYLNRGDEISASSVGVTYGNKLLIGSITDRQVLICEMES